MASRLDMKLLCGEWLHSAEEDTPDETVYPISGSW
jgi:hypothetical protein